MNVRWPKIVALIAGIALVGVGALGGYSLAVAGKGTETPVATVDRASLEELLAAPKITPTGETKTFDLTVAETSWELLPGVTTDAITFNGTVPGPMIRVTEGDAVVINVRNELTEPTSIHWHGLHVPNSEDGVAGVTQEVIAPGSTFTYRFTAPHAGTFMYHSHGPNSLEQMDRGLYAPFIIDPAGGDSIAADKEVVLAIGNWMVGDGMDDMGAMSMEYNYFTLNGKSFPATSGIEVREGDLLRLRFINPSQTLHPMHLHGMDMAVIAKDGEALAQPQRINTLVIAPGDTYDVVIRADNPGTWLLHCHDLHHATNAGEEPGGLIVPVIVTPTTTSPAPSTSPGGTAEPTSSPSDAAGHTIAPGMTPMPGMSEMPG